MLFPCNNYNVIHTLRYSKMWSTPACVVLSSFLMLSRSFSFQLPPKPDNRSSIGGFSFLYKTASNTDTKIGMERNEPDSRSLSSSTTTNGTSLLLPFRNHTHNSLLLVIPDETIIPKDDDDEVYSNKRSFVEAIKETITSAKVIKKSSLWIQVPMSRCSLLEDLQPLGFQFHHAEGHTAHLYLWLQEHFPCKIPDYATHQVGVGAVVINSKNEILCVRELRNNYRPWKIPGGLAELGEHLDEAVIREVKEETGIECTFQSILGVRHTHKVQFGRSDLFFVCRLKPIEDTKDETSRGVLNQPIAQEGEIAAAAWIPLEEYKAMVNSEDEKQGHPMMKQIMQVVEQDDGENDIQQIIVQSIVPGRPPSPVYHAPLLHKKRNV